MPYEQGMVVEFNAATKEVFVSFRGHRVALPAKYDTSEEGKAAGEAYCRDQGWNG